jgi:hypothetical protein
MSSFVRTITGVLIAAIALSAWPPPEGRKLRDPIRPGSKYTYQQLVGTVFNHFDAGDDNPTKGSGFGSVAIREFDGPGTPAVSDAEIKAESVNVIATPGAGTGRALLSFVSPIDEQNFMYLAWIDLTAEKAKLLDVVRMPGTPDDSGSLEQTIQLNEKTLAFVFRAYHSNSSRGHEEVSIIFIHSDRIQMLGHLAMLSGKGDHRFKESVSISTQPDPGREYNKVLARATLQLIADPPDSDHRPRQRRSTRIYTNIYLWDPDKEAFIDTNKAIAVIDEYNKDKY